MHTIVYLIQRKFAYPYDHIYLLIQIQSNLSNPYGYILPTVEHRIVVTQGELELSCSDVDTFVVLLPSLFQVETTKVFLRDTSVISPYSLLLFGGSMVIKHQVLYLSKTRLLDSHPLFISIVGT